jgi:hypothetical protein
MRLFVNYAVVDDRVPDRQSSACNAISPTKARPNWTLEDLYQRLERWRRYPRKYLVGRYPDRYSATAFRNLERAYARYHSHQARFPTFKKRGRSDGFGTQIRVDSSSVRQTTAFHCRCSVGCATATVAMFWVRNVVQQQLEKGEISSSTHLYSHSQRAQRLPA